jgi:hypothetical protein
VSRKLAPEDPEHIILLSGNIIALKNLTHIIDQVIMGIHDVDNGPMVFVPELFLLDIFAQ